MRLNGNISTHIYETFEANKAVSKASFSKGDIDNICFTINAINGLAYGKSTLGDNHISDYEIPELFAELIVPVRVRYSTDYYARDFKSSEYAINAMQSTGKLLDPHMFTQTWSKILGGLRIKQQDRASVATLRTEQILSALDKRLYPTELGLCIPNGNYLPIEVDTAFYENFAYSMSVNETFTRWLDEVIIASKK